MGSEEEEEVMVVVGLGTRRNEEDLREFEAEEEDD